MGIQTRNQYLLLSRPSLMIKKTKNCNIIDQPGHARRCVKIRGWDTQLVPGVFSASPTTNSLCILCANKTELLARPHIHHSVITPLCPLHTGLP